VPYWAVKRPLGPWPITTLTFGTGPPIRRYGPDYMFSVTFDYFHKNIVGNLLENMTNPLTIIMRCVGLMFGCF